MARVIESLLQKNPALAALLGQGLRIRNPHKPQGAATGVAAFVGKRFPTKFNFKGHEAGFQLVRGARLNAHVRVTLETDAANDYFKRDEEAGTFELRRVAITGRLPATNYQWPRLHDGLAHFSLNLPYGVADGDDLEYEAVISDPSRIEPFINRFILTVLPERESTNGGGGGRHLDRLEDEGVTGRGASGQGSDNSRDSHLDVPETTPVYEKDWSTKEPPFDKFTCLRIKRQPSAEKQGNKYDYFLNMDNVHLQTYLKARPKDAPGMRLRFTVGMTLVALALLHQDQLHKKNGRRVDLPEVPNSSIDVADRVAQVTSALAPFLLPMIENVAELQAPKHDDEALSESAGEAA